MRNGGDQSDSHPEQADNLIVLSDSRNVVIEGGWVRFWFGSNGLRVMRSGHQAEVISFHEILRLAEGQEKLL